MKFILCLVLVVALASYVTADPPELPPSMSFILKEVKRIGF